MHEVAYDLMKTDIVSSLILGPRRTSEGFSPDEDPEKRSRFNTMSALLGSCLCHTIRKF